MSVLFYVSVLQGFCDGPTGVIHILLPAFCLLLRMEVVLYCAKAQNLGLLHIPEKEH
jgi:hypothetical protein